MEMQDNLYNFDPSVERVFRYFTVHQSGGNLIKSAKIWGLSDALLTGYLLHVWLYTFIQLRHVHPISY